MSINFNSAVTKLKGAAPWKLSNVVVGSRPVFLYAYGMGVGDKVCVRRIVTGGDESGFVSSGCTTNQPVPGSVVARSGVNACGNPVCMDKDNASVQLPEPGSYELVGEGPGFAAGTVIIEEAVWTGDHSPASCPEPVEIGSLPDIVISELPIIEIKKHVVDTQVVCSDLWYIWSDGTKTTETLPVCPVPVTYCPSLRISCDGQAGFGFHLLDPKDPAATVELAPCPGDTSMDSIWIYPSAGPGHTLKVTDCDGNPIGYAANKSDCAPDCGCPKDPVITVNNSFKPTTNVGAPNITLPAPNLVAHALSDTGVLTSTLSNGQTVVSNPLPIC